ncbi:MAG: hypothetical protein MPL62_01425 [Alphaproteobacteria bacterium]|nr:hypothetical protein [Alphaproteobacteria bacterium]
MHPLGQGSSRSAKTENDTLTPGRRLAPSAGCLRYPAGSRDSRGVSFSPVSKLCLSNQKKMRRRQ